MVAILVWEARDVGLAANQWFWLIVVTTLVAGACIWIISWGDDEEEEEAQLAQIIEGENVASEIEAE
jgi:nucleoside recognition membrane protein YjiH